MASSTIFNFCLKSADLAARLHASCAHDLPQGEWRIWLLFHRKFINRLLKHCEMLKKAVISTVGKTKDHGKLLAICFLQKNIDSFLRSISAAVSGKIAHTGKKKKRNCATITSFSSVYNLIGYGSRPISALAVSTEPIASQLVRVRETSFAI